MSFAKFSKDSIAPLTEDSVIRLKGAQNEHISFQLVVNPEQMSSFSLTTNDLVYGDSFLAKENINIYEVEYVYASEGVHIPEDTGNYPDPLDDYSGDISLTAGQNHPFWIGIDIPEVTNGMYQGVLDLSLNGNLISVPLELEVYPFKITNNLKMDARVSTPFIDDYGDSRSQALILDDIYRNTVEHGGSVFSPTDPVFTIEPSDGRTTVDFSAMDQNVDYALNLGYRELGVYREIGYIGGYRGTWFGYPYTSTQFFNSFSDYLSQLSSYLDNKNVNAYLFFWDEPTLEQYADVSYLADFIRNKSVINLKHGIIEQPEAIFDNQVSFYVPKMENIDLARIEERKQAGDEIWVYDNRLYYIPNNVLDLRTLFWKVRKYELDGVLWWGTTWWRQATSGRVDPWVNPTPDGGYKPGDGFFLYPRIGGGPPLSSIRWEMIRGGIYDYNYLELLLTKYEEATSLGRDVSDATLLINDIYSVVFLDSAEISQKQFSQLKERIAEQIIYIDAQIQYGPLICGDGICTVGEDCEICSADCLSLDYICCSGISIFGSCCSPSDCDVDQTCENNECCNVACTLESCPTGQTCINPGACNSSCFNPSSPPSGGDGGGSGGSSSTRESQTEIPSDEEIPPEEEIISAENETNLALIPLENASLYENNLNEELPQSFSLLEFYKKDEFLIVSSSIILLSLFLLAFLFRKELFPKKSKKKK